MITVSSSSAQVTRRIGTAIAARAEPGDAILLEGSLGSGKTTLVQGVAEGLGIPIPATSPTFTLIHELRGGRMLLYHVDLYRINSQEHLEDLGITDLLDGEGLLAIEWADRLGSLLPSSYLHITITMAGEDRRVVRLEAHGAGGQRLLRAVEELAPC
ncbi:MAG: tRNA (adenosine(37)-N6)-threonylcarbamoyltransferase complex ATPase subunit type 1 TsaE [Chthonomonadales bacterium]